MRHVSDREDRQAAPSRWLSVGIHYDNPQWSRLLSVSPPGWSGHARSSRQWRCLVLPICVRPSDEHSLEPSCRAACAEGLVGAAVRVIKGRWIERRPGPWARTLNPVGDSADDARHGEVHRLQGRRRTRRSMSSLRTPSHRPGAGDAVAGKPSDRVVASLEPDSRRRRRIAAGHARGYLRSRWSAGHGHRCMARPVPGVPGTAGRPDGRLAPWPAVPMFRPPQETEHYMRTEIQGTVDQIKQAMSLLRRHL